MTASLTSVDAVAGATTSFINAYKAWVANVPNSEENLFLASEGFASSLSALIASNETLETEFGAAGLPAAIQALKNDYSDFEKVGASPQEQFSAILAAVSIYRKDAAEISSLFGGTATYLANSNSAFTSLLLLKHIASFS